MVMSNTHLFVMTSCTMYSFICSLSIFSTILSQHVYRPAHNSEWYNYMGLPQTFAAGAHPVYTENKNDNRNYGTGMCCVISTCDTGIECLMRLEIDANIRFSTQTTIHVHPCR